jgi:hypothetical protein
LMHLFKKLTFVINAQHSFCMNYYVSLANPTIFPQSMFTAIELVTLKPVVVYDGIDELIMKNADWVHEYLPNSAYVQKANGQHKEKSLVKTIAERLIDRMGGDALDKLCYSITMKKWHGKWRRKKLDVARCQFSAGRHFNTPLNCPEDRPVLILKRQETIFNKACNLYNKARKGDATYAAI